MYGAFNLVTFVSNFVQSFILLVLLVRTPLDIYTREKDVRHLRIHQHGMECEEKCSSQFDRNELQSINLQYPQVFLLERSSHHLRQHDGVFTPDHMNIPIFLRFIKNCMEIQFTLTELIVVYLRDIILQ